MKIRMLTGMAGADFSLSPGEETDRFGTAEAERLVAAGYAAPVSAPKVDRAVRKPVKERR